MAPPERRRTRPSWPPRAAVLGGLLVVGAVWLVIWLAVAGLGHDLLRGPAPTVIAAPAPTPLPELPGPLSFSGGAAPPAAGGVGHRPRGRPARTVAPGVVSMLLDHVHAGLPRGAKVRVEPSPQVAAVPANAAAPAQPSLRLTTLRRAGAPHTAPGVPVPDTMPPAVTCQTIDPGWHADNVSISCSAEDAGSGLADPSDAHFVLSTQVPDGSEDSQAQTNSHELCDAAGNCALAGAVALAVDREAPDVSCDPPDRSWQSSNETIGCTATDAGSGLADEGDSRLTLSTSVAAGTEDAAAGTDTEKVCDAVGNCTTAGPVTGLHVDRQGPRVHLAQQPDGADGWFTHAPAELDAVGVDDELAHVTCAADAAGAARGPSASGAKGATLQFTDDGTYDVTCTALDQAGNATTASATVRLDTGPPALSLATDQRSYGVDDTVTVTCAATDPVSGIAAKDCPPRSAPASSFAPGTNTIDASATDAAGNQATATASFDVTVTVAGLSAVTRRLVTDAQAADTLVADLKAVGDAADAAAKDQAVQAYEDDVRALPGQVLSPADTATLLRLAAGL